MATPLDPLRGLYAAQPAAPLGGAQPAGPANAPTTADGKTFQDVLSDFVKQVDQTQHQFDAAITAVERGETDNLHRVMIAQNQAQLSLKLAVEVRNKLVEAYKDVMRTQF
jgi:flagellar hook-basal body complex protein FliE